MYCEQIPVLSLNLSSLVGVVEMKMSQAGVRTKQGVKCLISEEPGEVSAAFAEVIL